MQVFAPIAACAVLLSGCATTPPSQAEIDACQEMEREMGVNQAHDHAALRGQGRNPMNLTHAKCMELLGRS